ncbi:MAG: hypothetical protein H6710_17480 [Myxococcales bacterium]|nr:hypothetical protein [Myxococcales bacterium]MCB9701029.1 hypothetical protein [Myxococcales bacterium]
MRRPAAALLALALVAPLITCGGLQKASVDDPCVDDPELCPPCASDDECVFQGNACTDYVACAHVNAELAFVQIGCSEALERRWPDDEACLCVESVCQSGLGDDW